MFAQTFAKTSEVHNLSQLRMGILGNSFFRVFSVFRG